MRALALALAVIVLAAAAALLAWRPWGVEPARAAAPEAAAPLEVQPAEPVQVVRPEALPETADARAGVAGQALPEEELAAAASAPAPAPGVVRGRCVDERGAPLAGVALRYAGQQAQSEGLGTFAIEVPAPLLERPRSRKLSGTLAGYARAEREVLLRAGETVELGDLVLAAGAVLGGRVVDADGQPVEGAQVACVEAASPDRGNPRWGPSSRVDDARTDAQGRFRLDHAPAGETVVAANAEGTEWTWSEVLELVPGERRLDLELALTPIPDQDLIEIAVVAPDGSPVPHARVRYGYRSGMGSGTGSTAADERGVYRHQLAARVPHDFHAADPKSRWSPAALEGVQPGARGVVLRLLEPTHVEVRVRDAGGAPVEAFELKLREAEGFRQELGKALDEGPHAEGVARAIVPSQRFEVVVDARGFDLAVRGPFEPAAAPERIEVELVPLPGVRGVVTAGGAPLAGAKVTLHAAVTPGGMHTVNGFRVRSWLSAEDGDTSDAEGRFALTLRGAGTWYVRAESAGLAPVELGPLALDAREGARGLQLALDEGGAIEGRVLAPPGASAAGVIVGASRADGFAHTLRSGGDGRFRFERLTPGRWLVERRDAELSPNSVTTTSGGSGGDAPIPWSCEVASGATTRFDLDLRDGPRCVLLGRLLLGGEPASGWKATLGSTTPSGALPSAWLDAQGRFRLEVEKPGSYHLGLRRETTVQYGFGTQIEVADGEQTWERDLPAGRLEGRVAPGWGAGEQQLQVHWSSEGLSFQGQIQPGPGGDYALAPVPAGTLRVQQLGPDGMQELAQVEILAGQTTRRDLP